MPKRSTVCKIIRIALCAAVFVSLLLVSAAAAEPVGSVGSAVFSNRGYGSLTDDSGLGAAAADAAAYALETELALVNGGDFAGNLLPGEQTPESIRFAFAEDRPLASCEVTPRQLKQMLELCLSRMTVDMQSLSIDRDASQFEAFPQVSGFTVRYDVSAPVGQRVMSIRTERDGELMLTDDSSRYTLAATEHFLAGGYGDLGFEPKIRPAGMTQCEALAAYIADGRMSGDYTDADRVKVIGCADNTIAGELGLRGLGILGCAAAAVIIGGRYVKRGEKHSAAAADAFAK